MNLAQYPIENEYSSYLSANSGHSNAYTAPTQTNYFFECAASHESKDHTSDGTNESANGTMLNGVAKGPLHGALDRFAQFFVKPLFLETTLDRELRAVDSENKKNLQSDAWRLSQLAKTLSNPKHPYHHFSTGNLQTLRDGPQRRGVKIRDEFIKFYEKHYSANRMKLVVLGREPLDQLETWVCELFSDVQNKDLPENRWDGIQPLTRDDLNTQIFAKPVMEARSLEIVFPFMDEEDLYETQPSRFISHLIGHEGPGSILAFLKDQGLVNALSAGAQNVCRGSAFFNIEISLTPEGLRRYPDVVKTVFQYIGMMKENPPFKWIHDEIKTMSDVDFRFQQKSPASRFTSRVSSIMQKPLPREWLLSGVSKIRRFDAEGIVQAMKYLREDNFRLMIVSQEYPGDWDMKEPWYGTEYRIEKIPTDVQSEIRKALTAGPSERPESLHLPQKNEFIPTRLGVERREIETRMKAPRLIRNDDRVRLWWKKDDSFWVPKANIKISIRHPLIDATPANFVKAVLFCHLVKDSLIEYSYDAEISGLAYHVSADSTGLYIGVHGYNDKMAVLLEKVLKRVKELEIKSERFEIQKERLSRNYRNWDFQQPYHQISDFTRWLVYEKAFIVPQYASELPHIQIEDVQSFGRELLSQSHVEILTHGNLYKEEAKKIADLVETTLNFRALPRSQWPLKRNIIIPPGGNYTFEHTLKDPANVNQAIEYYLHVGPQQDIHLRGLLQVFAQMTDEPAFDQLRTKEQLGYVVWSGIRITATTMGYRILVQSERNPEYLETRCNAFLLKFKKDLDAMSEEDFEGHKRSVINKRLEKLKNLEQETSRLWSYINSEYYNFYQVDQDVEAIRTLTKKDVQEFFAKFIDPESSTRAKLSIHLLAQDSHSDTPKVDPAEQKAQYVELVGQYLGSAGADVEMTELKQSFGDVDLTDQDAVLKTVKGYIGSALPISKVNEILAATKEVLPQLMVALKIKPPVPKTNGVEEEVIAQKIPTPVLIEDVWQWKAGLRVSEAPVPVTDLKEFEEVEPKL